MRIVPLDAMKVKGHACVRAIGDEFVGQLHRGQDYHEFIRDSIMEAMHAIRVFCRINDIHINEITLSERDGRTIEGER